MIDKKTLRQKHLDRRLNADSQTVMDASSKIQAKLWEHVEKARTIGIYVAMEHEVQTMGLIDRALKAGKIVCVPKIVDKAMVFVRLTSFADCAVSRFGIMEPISNQPYSEPIELQIVPMLAFNERLYRLGYGKGYYDSYLKDYKGLKLGICFADDQDENLSETVNDVACDMILTESHTFTQR